MKENLVMVSSERNAHDAADLAHRLRNILLRADLNCECRQTLAGTLDRFAAFEQRRMLRNSLALARDQKARIVNILQLLSDLDDLTEGERDQTVFEEMALLFVDIAECANAGAAALRAND
jgi:hypothetical protein